MIRTIAGPRTWTLAGAALVFSGGLAVAAPALVTTELNVRAGEGTRYPVIAVMPAGTVVDARGCGDGWCFIAEYNGYASSRYLEGGARSAYRYAAPPPVVVGPPPPAYRYHSRPTFEQRIIRQGARSLNRAVRRELRQERRETRQERRQERREARQERRQEQRGGS